MIEFRATHVFFEIERVEVQFVQEIFFIMSSFVADVETLFSLVSVVEVQEILF